MSRLDDETMDGSLPVVHRKEPEPTPEPELPPGDHPGGQDTSPADTNTQSSGVEQPQRPELPTEKRGAMRHVPPRAWFERQIDRDLRAQLDVLYQLTFATSHENHQTERRIEDLIRNMLHELKRIAHLLGGQIKREEPQHIRVDIENALIAALSAIRMIEEDEFRVRASSQDFHRSPWEKVWASWLLIEHHLGCALELLVEIEPEAREKMLERTAPEAWQYRPALENFAIS